MKRIVGALLGVAGLTIAASMPAAADLSLTEVALSCNDGHSVSMAVDQLGLTSLLADVGAINASGTGLACTAATPTVDPSSEQTEWTVYDYNPSDRAIAPRNSPNSMPATTADGVTWTFPFKPGVYTALFTTRDRALTGNLLGRQINDTITVSGDATSFMTQFGGGDCTLNVPAAVRFYFTAPSASGPSTGTPPAGFYTRFWWSDVQHMDMVNGTFQTQPLSESMTPADWSDWNGQPAATQSAAFIEAASHVQSIGLSFGGDCFFETGVTPTQPFTNETFSSTFGES